MAEKIITMIMGLIVAVPLILLGISQIRSKNAVVFWNGEKPPFNENSRDVKLYNRKHGFMWISYAIGLMIACLFVIPFEKAS